MSEVDASRDGTRKKGGAGVPRPSPPPPRKLLIGSAIATHCADSAPGLLLPGSRSGLSPGSEEEEEAAATADVEAQRMSIEQLSIK